MAEAGVLAQAGDAKNASLQQESKIYTSCSRISLLISIGEAISKIINLIL
ncbi:hypothetical protein ABID22_002672 [Pontibacter aydingkolensis]